jgi:hypothetical protein
MKEEYKGYLIIATPLREGPEKWSVSVIIEKNRDGEKYIKTFYAFDKIQYILEVEAAKECLNLGRNLIDMNLTDL